MAALGACKAYSLALVLAAAAASAARAQDTPGGIPDPSSYKGSMALQQQEQQSAAQVQMQNQQMMQRLDNTYRAYAPGRGGGGGGRGGGPPPVNWWAKPPLPPAKNPLLGKWRQTGVRQVSGRQVDVGLGSDVAGATAQLYNGVMAGGCQSMFGKGVVAFEPDSLQWVAPDGHEEILNHVAYRASGADVVVLSRDPGAIPALFFGFAGHDHAAVALFNCTMERLGARPPAGAPPAQVRPASAPMPGPTPAPAGPANAVLRFTVGASEPGGFTPFPAAQIYVTAQDPAATMGGSPLGRLRADCGDAQACVADFKAMTAHSLGAVRTDAQGHAQTPAIAAGRYYLVGIYPYQGHAIFWNVPVNLQPGANSVTLDQTNGASPR